MCRYISLLLQYQNTRNSTIYAEGLSRVALEATLLGIPVVGALK